MSENTDRSERMTGQVQERVTYDDEGRLDEIVGAGVAHLEHMNKDEWFLEIGNTDGTSTALWFKCKNFPTWMEKRDAPKRMTGTPSKDRAGTRHAAYEILCRIDAPTDDKRIGIVAADLDKAFAEGMKRAAEIARKKFDLRHHDQARFAGANIAAAILAEIPEAK